MSGGDCSIRLREDAVPFALSTRVNPFGGCRQAGATDDGRSSSDQACGHTYGLVCGHGSRGQAHIIYSTVEGEERETHKVRICVDITKLNESVMREKHDIPSVDQTLGRLVGANVFTMLDANSGF